MVLVNLDIMFFITTVLWFVNLVCQIVINVKITTLVKLAKMVIIIPWMLWIYTNVDNAAKLIVINVLLHVKNVKRVFILIVINAKHVYLMLDYAIVLLHINVLKTSIIPMELVMIKIVSHVQIIVKNAIIKTLVTSVMMDII